MDDVAAALLSPEKTKELKEATGRYLKMHSRGGLASYGPLETLAHLVLLALDTALVKIIEEQEQQK